MNDQEMKEMVGAICPTLDLDGCYFDIVPRVTGQQLAQLLDVAEQGDNAKTWSHLAVEFLQYGQQDVIATHIDRLVPLIKGSGSAAWVLVEVPGLAHRHLDMLVPLIKGSGNAAWVLVDVPSLAHRHLDMLVPLVAHSSNAVWVLGYAPNLSDDHRNTLVALVKDSRNADWVRRNAPDLTDEHREHLAKIAS